jgi:hypothetical protein
VKLIIIAQGHYPPSILKGEVPEKKKERNEIT